MPRSTRADRKTRNAPYNSTLGQQASAAPLTADRRVALAAAFGVTEADVVYEAWIHSGTSAVSLGWGAGWAPPITTAGNTSGWGPAPATSTTWGTGDGWGSSDAPSTTSGMALTSRWGIWGSDGQGAGDPRPTSSGWDDTAWSDAAWAAHDAAMAATETPAAPSTTGETPATSS
ncbi:hypothetical protein C8F04DRAFT_1255917 [Mycena alexandri]|uniref:Uncharacterized protein n=1 Tax=Mycena alexandri TaxID=1745969 RepID=A0AAD6X6P5_9AGAR|nr:hypothetical protein C8F04DRAFT_1255917 [Mycena alexandri]